MTAIGATFVLVFFISYKSKLMLINKIHNKGQAQLFKNRYLEFFTKTHPLVVLALYLPLMGGLLYYSRYVLHFSAGRIVLMFLGGMFFWSLFEYLIHRYAFHFAGRTKRAARFIYIIHGNHHEYPRDRQRLLMPPVPSIVIASIIFALLYLVCMAFGISRLLFPFYPGFILGYLLYGTMHYAIHAWNPPFKWMKPLWRNHHLHHYKEQEKGFGVSSTLWDHVFGTMFDLTREKEDKEKVKALMFESRTVNQKVS
jgi:sterol desaturase/sphingolipid hydroxylase (fatty acid hydroxylase superfamily)